MLKRKRLRHNLGSQQNLFHPPLEIPAWHTLAAPVRERTAALLARLIRQHRLRRIEAGETQEVGDE